MATTLTVTFNSETLAEAKTAFGLSSDGAAINLATTLLKIATQAKKDGKDLAIIQDIRNGNSMTMQADALVDLKQGVEETPTGAVFVTTRSLKKPQF